LPRFYKSKARTTISFHFTNGNTLQHTATLTVLDYIKLQIKAPRLFLAKQEKQNQQIETTRYKIKFNFKIGIESGMFIWRKLLSLLKAN